MADPLSVAGLAAGLVSLGLQVCGGVIAYIDALDCRDQDLASLRHQHNSVLKTLQVVEASLAQLQRNHLRATAAARSCLDACHAELEDLSALVAEFSTGPRSETSRREKLKRQGKKLLYPFSRAKLERLETRLRNANAALQLALQALGLSVSQFGSEKLAEIESISYTMSASLSAISTPLNSLHTRFDSLEHLVTQLVVHSPVLASQVATPPPSPRQLGALKYPRRLTPPHTPPASPTSSEPVSPTTPRGDQFQALVSSFTGGIGTCICRPSRFLKRDTLGWGPVGLSFETAGQKHLPGCPLSHIAEQDQTRTIGFKYTGIRHLLGSVIEFSLAMRSSGGCWAISPNFTYYPTVDPMTAPEFRILRSLERSLCFALSREHLQLGKGFPFPQWEKLVALALAKILRLFQARKASPFSVNFANQSLTHLVARCIWRALYIERKDLAQPLIELLRYLIMHNVPAHRYDLTGSSPLSLLLWRTYGATGQHLEASELILRSSPESCPPCLSQTPYPYGSPYLKKGKFWVLNPIAAAMGFLSSSTRLAETYGCGPLCLAVLADDTTQVEFLLKHHPSTLGERTLFGQSPVHLAVKHPSCLRLLVRLADSDLLNLTDDDGTSALETAVKFSRSQCNNPEVDHRCRRCHCAESTVILIKAGCAIPVTPDLQKILQSASFRSRRRYVRGIRARREDLKRLARENLPANEAERLGLFKDCVLDSLIPPIIQLLEQRGVQVPEILRHCPTRGDPVNCVYHALTNAADADLFFEMGFHDLNFSQQDYTQSVEIRSKHLIYLEWLERHGVDLLSQQVKSFKAGTAILVAHFTFGSIGRSLLRGENWPFASYIPWFRKFLASALSGRILDAADNCHCECWPGGCTPLTSFSIAVAMDSDWIHGAEVRIKDPGKPARRWAWCVRNFGHILEPDHHLGTLRLMTFEALQIRHTCCHPYLYLEARGPGWARIVTDSPDLIEEHTPDELALLEELVDEFGRELAPILADEDQGRRVEGLVNFWEQVWPKRMVEVREELEGDKLSEEERRRAEEVGVVWDRPAGPEVPKGGNPYEKTMEEYWFYEMDQIVVD